MMNSFDLSLFHQFNSLAGRNRLLDLLVINLTNEAPVVFGILFLFYFFWQPAETNRLRRVIILAGLSGVLAMIMAVALASVVYRPRPFMVLPGSQVRTLITHAADSSFPSDHATGSAAFAVGMWHGADGTAKVIFTITAVLVGISRLIAGVHWPSDILVSFLLGGIAAQILFKLAKPLTPVIDWILNLVNQVEQSIRPRGGR